MTLMVTKSTAENAPTVNITGIGIYTGTVKKTFTISPKPVTITGATATNRNYVKDDTSVSIDEVTFSDNVLLSKDTDYVATGVMADDMMGDSKDVIVTVTMKNSNYAYTGHGIGQ